MDWSTIASGAKLDAGTCDRLATNWHDRPVFGYTTTIRQFDFDSYGKPFTQVAIVLEPEQPLVIDGRRVVIAASEGGHDIGREFILDFDGKEAIGPWLARRGVTFIALCRVGRWNFLTDRPLGSWIDIPLEDRVPIYSRHQKRHWGSDQFAVEGADRVSSATGSLACRVARRGSELEAHMMAATPHTVLTGFERALLESLPLARRNALLFYWGFSTGGPYMWALGKRVAPDGVLGFGMTNFAISRFASAANDGRYDWLYDASAFRIRERGKPDFLYYARHLEKAHADRQYQAALHSPRFKSTEDTFMFFNIAALSETLSRLWSADFLPADARARGFVELFRENVELCMPDRALAGVHVLELFGTQDEVMLTAKDPMLAASVTSGYCGSYKIVFLEGLHHCIDAEHARVFGSAWLDAIGSGYFRQVERQ